MKTKKCNSPSGKCVAPSKCKKLNKGKGGCMLAIKGVKPGQVTGKSGGY